MQKKSVLYGGKENQKQNSRIDYNEEDSDRKENYNNLHYEKNQNQKDQKTRTADDKNGKIADDRENTVSEKEVELENIENDKRDSNQINKKGRS